MRRGLQQEYKSTDTFTLNTSALGGHLIAGLLDSTSTGTAFNTLEFTAQVGGTTVVDQTFTTLTAAQNFFHDNPVDLGAVPASANLQVALTFDLKAGTAGSFGMDYLLGVTVIPCFCAGAHIATPRGEIRVEVLRERDLVVLARGRMAPILWIGRRHIDCRRHAHAADILPVRVRAGAFGERLPARDLLLSPDHAVLVDHVLVPIRHLINGCTVVQEWVAQVTYYHVELPAHDVILAEGLPCESYLDTGNRAAFEDRSTSRSSRGERLVKLTSASGGAG